MTMTKKGAVRNDKVEGQCVTNHMDGCNDLTTCRLVVKLKSEVIVVANKTRLGLYLEDEELKRQIKVAAARRGVTVTNYCARAIEERLIRDGERGIEDQDKNRIALLSRIDKLRQETGPIGMSTAELVEHGRRR